MNFISRLTRAPTSCLHRYYNKTRGLSAVNYVCSVLMDGYYITSVGLMSEIAITHSPRDHRPFNLPLKL